MELVVSKNAPEEFMSVYQRKNLGGTVYRGRLSAIGVDNLRKYQICYFNLGQAVKGDSTQKGIRPCIIVSNNTNNKYSPMLTVIPLTTRRTKKKLPTHFEMLLGSKYSVALGEQIMIMPKSKACVDNPVDNPTFVNYVNEVSDRNKGDIDRILRVQLGL